jgi:phosphoglycerate kinase
MKDKNVLVRCDLEWIGENCSRRQATKNIITHLQSEGAKRIKVIGHKGNIDQVNELGVDLNFDLRADPREETNDSSLAQELALGFDVYINEAFATSHRTHCSIDALPRFMKSQGCQTIQGIRFKKEITTLSQIKNGLLIIGGAKASDKAKYADEMEEKGWIVLRGGLLQGVDLRPDGLDVSPETISNIKYQISNSQIIVLAGPVGKYEEAPEGTREIFTAVANSGAYKIAGGGDTEAALAKFGLLGKFNWISVGGGAMLEYLSAGTLAGIEAL